MLALKTRCLYDLLYKSIVFLQLLNQLEQSKTFYKFDAVCVCKFNCFYIRRPNRLSFMVAELTTHGSWWHQEEMFKYVYRQNSHHYCIKFVFAAVTYDTFRGEMKIYTRKLPPPLQVSVLNYFQCLSCMHMIILQVARNLSLIPFLS